MAIICEILKPRRDMEIFFYYVYYIMSIYAICSRGPPRDHISTICGPYLQALVSKNIQYTYQFQHIFVVLRINFVIKVQTGLMR